jgi:hypothetical protein
MAGKAGFAAASDIKNLPRVTGKGAARVIFLIAVETRRAARINFALGQNFAGI